MMIYAIAGGYAGMVRDGAGGGWYASGRTRSEVIDKLISRLVMAWI